MKLGPVTKLDNVTNLTKRNSAMSKKLTKLTLVD